VSGISPALPGRSSCSREPGRGSEGRGCSRPRRRETAIEAEAALVRRAAAEAEAGEARSPAPVLSEGGKGGGKGDERE
jgi:hypothetical protein